jgi:RNA polymerase-binding protein DksA
VSHVRDDELVGRLRGELEKQRADLRSEIEHQGADPDSDELTFEDESGFSDRSHTTEERSRLLSVVRALRSNLRDVERAMTKMDRGTYGVCERCGSTISQDRLEAIPWAVLCIDCKRKGGG